MGLNFQTVVNSALGDFFALRVKGESTEPTLFEDDTIIVKQQSTADNGDIVVVLVNGDEATVKEFSRNQNGITLIGHNVKVYPPHFYSWEEIENLPLRVIGKVVELRRKIF